MNMERGNFQINGGRYDDGFSENWEGFNLRLEPPLPSSSLPPLPPHLQGSTSGLDMGHYSNDFSRMHDTPLENLHHRCSHSDFITVPSDINFDNDAGMVGDGDVHVSTLSDGTNKELMSLFLDMDKFGFAPFQVGEQSSPSVSEPMVAGATPSSGALDTGFGSRARHLCTQSLDSSTTLKPEIHFSGSEERPPIQNRQSISTEQLDELAIVDPKRAKRILTNRQSASRYKERKIHYICELERKVQALQAETTSLSAQQSLLQMDTNGLNFENNELKHRLQTMEQQVHLQDVLHDALKEEIQHLKKLTGQTTADGGFMMNLDAYGSAQNFDMDNLSMRTLLIEQQLQQLQLQSEKQHLIQQQQRHLFQQQQRHLFQQQQQQLHQLQQEHQRLIGFMALSSPRNDSDGDNYSAMKN